ncbi:Inner membrane protein YrbG, predicted calcium/sodium:proton antiporter [Lunatimonas lonarensis]|uniref:Inner membrane protein YrbG, predicted calcium/sodium:proton antiporter n=1 Tax=Lunatimonas lonarensis TaxID=1232681 RepID=R7ZUC4_9BACT|nr:calcium/sodium antiporter [Lunatimonas lonarensis]EON77761.1 Inner membrane protein YrbG, predicted calcium/sodium:proton antiporter [Lunatimonas lonarensis]
MIPYILLVLGLSLLLVGGKTLVDGASAIAARLGLSAGLIGLTIVAFGTSAPELLVCVTAALKGNSDIAVGNVVGSNIANITLVLGITGLVFPVVITPSILRMDYTFTMITTVLFFLLALNGVISFVEGLVLVTLFVLVNMYFFKKIGRVEISDEETVQLKKKSVWISIGYVLLGVGGLYLGSELFVENGVIIATSLGVSERIIGITVIAVGTSLPELITSVIAAIKKETDIAIGNVLGSNMMNILSIIGITALVRPIPISADFIYNDFIWMIAFTAILFPLMRIRYAISRIDGGILLVGYAVYIFFLLW